MEAFRETLLSFASVISSLGEDSKDSSPFSSNGIRDLSHLPEKEDFRLHILSIETKANSKRRLCEAFKFVNKKGYKISHLYTGKNICPLRALLLFETRKKGKTLRDSYLEKRYGIKVGVVMWFMLGIRNIEVPLNPTMTKREKEWYLLGLEVRREMTDLVIDRENA